jgi:hypothetical protein
MLSPRKFKDMTADVGGEGLTYKIVGIAIGLFVAAVLLPSALVTIANASLSGVDASVVTIFTILLPILAVIAIAMMFLRGGE